MAKLPAAFSDLEPFADDWSIATMSGRHAKRVGSTPEERRRFYDAMVGRFDAILDYLDQWELEAIEGENLNLLRLALTAVQVGLAVDVQGSKEEAHSRYARQIKFSKELDDI